MSIPRKAFTGIDSLTNRFAVLSTYRQLLRATRIAFNGDTPTLTAARSFARERFQANRGLRTDSAEAGQELEHAQGVTRILRENLVQGREVEADKYKLNIHEHTQRLDNDTAGNLKGTKKSFKDIKNSMF